MTDLATVQHDLAPIRHETSELLQALQSFDITTADDYQAAAMGLQEIKGRWRAADDRRQFFVRPLNDHVGAINDLFRTLLEPLASAERLLKGKMAAYSLAQAKANEEAMQATARAVQAQDAQATALAVQALAPAPTAPGIATRMEWDFEVIDPDLVPRAFMVVSTPKLVNHCHPIRSHETPAAIPGVRFFLKARVIARAI